ncbi:hypothetical protein Cgig2_031049 [Carnegiea gigantea]|uniref:pyridoxal 5'-phosphate synthase n=1 Tax=Carnegiea gigantea TaxID=171969 RepID=A0A9Q1KCC5_9CARY|nr:hypothetical protein Cgig2_031049 [Carnegiea gigantea]
MQPMSTAGAAGTPPSWKQLLLHALQANSHLKHSSYFQFATVGANGRPSNRTVVFRGFQDETDRIQINTDSRFRKDLNLISLVQIEDLKHCPFAEICWYFTDSWEQFRINGMVDVIDGSNPDPAKLQRKVPLAPAVVDVNFLLTLKGVYNLAFDPQRIHDRTGFNNFLELHSIPEDVMQQREKSWFASSLRSRMQYLGPDVGLPSINEELPKNISLDPFVGPVGAFCLLVLDPEKVDYLNLKTNTRQVFECSGSLNGDRCWTSGRINP